MISINSTASDVMNELLKNEQVRTGLEFLKSDNMNTTEEQIEITAIESPTF